MGLFNGMFGKRTVEAGADMSELAVDMHSHLIPGIDDGVKTLDESIALIRKFSEMGYRKLITTPHINERFPNHPNLILEKLALVTEAIEKENIPIELVVAAEYQLGEFFEQHMKNASLLTFGDNYLLIECSYYFQYPGLSKLIYELQSQGYNLILAHAERYSYWHDMPHEYERLKDREVLFQVNFSSLTGQYTTAVRNMARKLIDKGWVEFAGSDVHNQRYFELFQQGTRDPYAVKLLGSGLLKNPTL